jgi:hypothetical protein
MSIFQSANQAINNANRRLLVVGSGGTGKTTFSISASKFAGDKIPAGERVICQDVLLIQGDSEGVMGAVSAGLVPGSVLDMTGIPTWPAYCQMLEQKLKQAEGLFKDGSIKVVVVDLAHPQNLILEMIKPADQQGWGRVAAEGRKLFYAFSKLTNVTVIGNAQVKSSQGPGEKPEAALAASAKAIGGERAQLTIDLVKGIKQPWIDNASFVLQRQVKRIRGEVHYLTHTTASMRHEAKSRAQNVLQPTEDGSITLRALLARAYGSQS